MSSFVVVFFSFFSFFFRRLQQVFTDATLTQGGMYLPPVEGESGEAEEYGNSLPAFLHGVRVRGMQTGVRVALVLLGGVVPLPAIPAQTAANCKPITWRWCLMTSRTCWG